MDTKSPVAKPSTYQPDKRTVGELLTTTNPPIVVPDWQRSYSWTTSHVETFWNDLLDFERRNPTGGSSQREYFLGSVVIVTTSDREHLLLDGQQRLATSAILLSVIRDNIKQYHEDAAKRLQARYLADIDDARGGELLYKLSLNAYDSEYFRRKILEYRSAGYKEPIATHASHSLIESARAYFEVAFETKYKTFGTPKEAYDWALRIQNVLVNHMSVVAVTSTDEDSAAEVFETLNDRGIGLSTPDLLRNLVIRRAPENIRSDIVELWGDIIQFETDAEIKAFLRHYWISHHGDIKTQRLYREIKTYVVENDVGSLIFSRELKDAAAVYRDIVAARDNDSNVERCLKSIEELGASVLYPVVLSTMEVVALEKRAQLLDAILNTYVRHSVIGQLENSKLENVIHKIATELRKKMSVAEALKALADFSPDNDAFVSAFQRASVNRTATQRYLLKELEIDRRTTGELTVNPPHKVHVEHIYPQTPQEGGQLANHAQIINRLGNLTLLDKALNVSIRNAAFDKKKPSYEKSELLLTKDLCGYSSWDATTVEDRQKALSKRASAVWPIITADTDNAAPVAV